MTIYLAQVNSFSNFVAVYAALMQITSNLLYDIYLRNCMLQASASEAKFEI